MRHRSLAGHGHEAFASDCRLIALRINHLKAHVIGAVFLIVNLRILLGRCRWSATGERPLPLHWRTLREVGKLHHFASGHVHAVD